MANQSLEAKPQFISGIWRSLLITIGITAILPYIIYRLASLSMPAVPALLLAGIAPALATLIDLVRSRRLNILGVLALFTIVLNLITGLLFRDARLVLVSYSFMPGIYGIIMLVSVLRGKPILLTLIKNMMAGASPLEREQVEKRWLGKGSSSFVFVTALWGVGLLLVPVICLILVYTLPLQQAVPVVPIIQYVIFGSLLLVSHVYSLIRRARGKKISLA